MKLNKHVAGVLEVLNAMRKGLHEMEDEDEFYNTRFRVGFGTTEAEFYCCASTYNSIEAALGNLLCAVIEEEDLEGEPYDSLYKQYEKYNNH